jgi:hypothetical protein
MRKFFFVATICLFISAFFNSCYYDKEDYLYPTPHNQTGGVCDTTNVTYNLTIKPIVESNCVGCHSSGASFNFSDFSSLSSYLSANTQKFLDNINYVSSQHMPPSNKLNDCYLNQTRIWIQAGYPNN